MAYNYKIRLRVVTVLARTTKMKDVSSKPCVVQIELSIPKALRNRLYCRDLSQHMERKFGIKCLIETLG